MKIGIIYQNELYWSLENLVNDIIVVLERNYEILTYCLNDANQHSSLLNDFYNNVDIVLNTCSKCIHYQKNHSKPTIFMGHAWMDHAAGITLYRNRDYIGPLDVITFASRGALKKFRYVYGNSLHSFLLPYFTTLGNQCTSESDIEVLFQQYKIPNDKKIVLYHGRINHEKNILGILKIYKSLPKDKVCLVIVGSGSSLTTYGFGNEKADFQAYEQEIQNYITAHGIQGVIFLPRIPRTSIITLLTASYININMTWNFEEDFGISAIETMILGTPLVSSHWGGLKDINLPYGSFSSNLGEHYGVNFDYEGVIQYMTKLILEPDYYQLISQKSSKKAQTHFSQEAFLCNFQLLLEQIKKMSHPYSTVSLLPKKWIEKIYDTCIKEQSTHSIYLSNPQLFYKLYKFYASPPNR